MEYPPDDLPLEQSNIWMHTFVVIEPYAATAQDVRRMTDEELLAIPRLGKGRLAHLREVFGPHEHHE